MSCRYRGYDARLDSEFPGLKSVEWTYTNPPFMGMGPVLDLKARDIACQKAAKPPTLKAVSRAGAEVTFYWTPYYQQHKGPIFTVSLNQTVFSPSNCTHQHSTLAASRPRIRISPQSSSSRLTRQPRRRVAVSGMILCRCSVAYHSFSQMG
jgi:hypothetical protein